MNKFIGDALTIFYTPWQVKVTSVPDHQLNCLSASQGKQKFAGKQTNQEALTYTTACLRQTILPFNNDRAG